MSFRTTVAVAIFVSSPVFADVDPCLVGTWQADLDDLAHIFAVQMEARNVLATGNVNLNVLPTGAATLTVGDLALDMDKEGIPPMVVTLNGATNFEFVELGGGAMSIRTEIINLVAQADVMGTAMVIPFSSAEGLFGGGLVEYGCLRNSFAVESGDPAKFPRKWTR